MLRARSKTYIITFLGPVGVGKSTQIRLLKEHLKSKNVRVDETFIKSSHGFAYILSRFLIALGTFEKVSYHNNTTRTYPRRDVVRKLFPLWAFLDTLSIAIKFFFRVYIPFSLGSTILIEEGLHMTLHTYGMSFPNFFDTEPKVPPLVPRLIGWIMSKNHVNVVLDATDDELDQRRRSRNFRQSELPEYVSLQRKWIKRLDSGDTIFLDTTEGTPLRVHAKVVKALEEHVFQKSI